MKVDETFVEINGPCWYSGYKCKLKVSYESKHLDLAWKSEEGRLAVTLPANSEEFEFLNGDEESRNAVKKALKDIYHYSGEFYFGEDDIPF